MNGDNKYSRPAVPMAAELSTQNRMMTPSTYVGSWYVYRMRSGSGRYKST
jgi:hypothetical protein